MAYSPDVITAGKTFMEEVLAHVPEADREAVRAAFGKPDAQEAIGVIGSGVKRQSDYSRDKDALAADRESLDQLRQDLLEVQGKQNAWWETNQGRLRELDTLKARGGTPPAAPPTDPTKVSPDLITKADLDKVVDEVERGGMGLILLQNRLMRKHWTAFGELLDMETLVADPEARKVGLEALYEKKYHEKYVAKTTAEQEARDKKLVEETEARVRRELGSRNIPGGPPERTTLDGLAPAADGKPPAADEDAMLDRAVAIYESESRRQQQTA